MNTRFVLALGCALISTSALAARNTGEADARERYLQERAVCMSGKSNQDRATCLREAGAAFNQARREGFRDNSAQNTANQRQRCEALPADDRQACIARMQGQGTTSGSAAAGGIYRELVTPVAPAPATTPEPTPTK